MFFSATVGWLFTCVFSLGSCEFDSQYQAFINRVTTDNATFFASLVTVLET